MTKRATILGAAAIGLAGVAVAFGPAGSDQAVGLLRPDDSSVVALGRDTYEAHCAACHGASLEGEPGWQDRRADGLMPAPPHDATGHTWHHPDAQLFAITKYGTEAVVGGNYRSAMIGFGDVLTDDEIIATLSFIKSTWPERVRDIHDERNAAFDASR